MAFAPNKRGATNDDQTYATRADMQDLLDSFSASFKSDVQAEVASSIKTFEENTSAALLNRTRELFLSHSSICEQRFEAVESDVNALKASHATLVDESKATRAQLDRVTKALALAESASSVQEVLDADEWDRPARLNVINVNSTGLMARSDVDNVVKEWLAGVGFEESAWTLDMPPSAYRGAITFSGDDATAARRAKAANLSLRKPDGNWTKLSVPNPTPTSDGSPSPPLPLFASPDAGPKARAQVGLGKKVKKILEEAYPGKKFGFKRDEAMVTLDRKDLAWISAESKDRVAPLWFNATLAQHGIDKKLVADKLDAQSFKRSQPSSSSAEWSF